MAGNCMKNSKVYWNTVAYLPWQWSCSGFTDSGRAAVLLTLEKRKAWEPRWECSRKAWNRRLAGPPPNFPLWWASLLSKLVRRKTKSPRWKRWIYVHVLHKTTLWLTCLSMFVLLLVNHLASWSAGNSSSSRACCSCSCKSGGTIMRSSLQQLNSMPKYKVIGCHLNLNVEFWHHTVQWYELRWHARRYIVIIIDIGWRYFSVILFIFSCQS